MSALQSLGKYQIVGELGHGGFASVYKAHDPDLGLDVALKVLEPNLMRDREFVERFRTEARVAARLRHPNIARVLNIDQAEGRLFIAIEYVAGHNLRDWLAQQPVLDWTQVSAIVQQMAEALDYAHAQGVLHRDVKPSNILLTDGGSAVLSDFGLAKAIEASHITTAGAAIGTYAYMAPEQASGLEVDARADLYSLGVVAYELCTGRVPFTSDSTPALIHDQVYTLPPTPSQVNSRVTGPIDTILLKALAKDPEQRYQTGQEFAADLKTAIAQATGEHLTVLYQEAVALQQRGELDTAEVKLHEVLVIRPGHTEAQARLMEIDQQRESQQRYQQLAGQVKAMRLEAVELHRMNPTLDDPDQILNLLAPSQAQPATSPTVSTRSHSKRSTTAILMIVLTGLLLLVGAAVLVYVGNQKTTEANVALRVQASGSLWDTRNAAIGNTLSVGNFLYGVSLGITIATLVWLIILAVTWRIRSKHG
jgi:predicted Ser/Thr protein kinase